MAILGLFGDLWRVFVDYLSLFSPWEHFFMVMFFASVFFMLRALVIRERIKERDRFR